MAGWADQLIFSTEWHYQLSLEAVMRGFMAQGALHCAGGLGAAASDPFEALVCWSEKGIAPDTVWLSLASSARLEHFLMIASARAGREG